MRSLRPSTFGSLYCVLILLSAGLAGCRPEPFPLPDPDEEIPPASCDEDVALGLSSTDAASTLDSPPWQQVCTLCPADSISLNILDEETNATPLVSAWADGGLCAVAMPQVSLSPEHSWTLEATIVDGERSGLFSAALQAWGERATSPLDLVTGTWLASGGVNSMRLPGRAPKGDPALEEIELPEVLLELSSMGKNGARSLSIGAAEDGVQDLCRLTTRIDGASLSGSGHLSATLGQGSRFPTVLGDVVKRGALLAQLSEDGDGLSEVAVLAVLDVEAIATESGGSTEETCAQWQEQLGSNPCVPCGDPAEATTALSHCITTVLEWSDVTRSPVPLQTVSAESISPDCPTP